jgi:hypothetical protein
MKWRLDGLLEYLIKKSNSLAVLLEQLAVILYNECVDVADSINKHSEGITLLLFARISSLRTKKTIISQILSTIR